MTQASAQLAYQGEAGGLNEASSDIFGAMAVAWLRNGAGTRIGDGNTTWTVSSNLQNGGALQLQRDLIRPSSVSDNPAPDSWSPGLARMDPHRASGPMNRAFYLLSQGASSDPKAASYSPLLPKGMTGIGNDKAATLWFRTLTTRLGSTSTYLDARQGALLASIELFGAGSNENVAVHKAFGAIGVGDPAAPLDDFEPPSITINTTQAGSTLRLLADARDNDRVAAVQWLVDQYVVGTTVNEPFSLVLDSGRLLANGPHQAFAYATDPSGNSAVSAEAGFTLDNPYQQLLADPGLERRFAASPWGAGRVNVGLPPEGEPGILAHGGSSYALFGQGGQVLSQNVRLPAGAAAASLRLWAWISGNPAGPREGPLTLQVRSLPGDPRVPPEVLATLAGFSSQDAWEDWLPYRFDLSAFSGQTVEIRLELKDPTPATRFRVDDLTLVCGTQPVEVLAAPGLLDLLTGETSQPLNAAVLGSGNQAVTWSVAEAGGGSLDGLRYRAPAQPGVYHLLATAQADPRVAAQVSVRVHSKVQVRPAAALLDTGASLTLELLLADGVEVDLALREGSAAGTVQRLAGSNQVRYTAPATPGSYHLLVSNRADASSQAVVSFTVLAPMTFVINPGDPTLAIGDSLRLSAEVNGETTRQATFRLSEGPAAGSLRPDTLSPDSGIQVYRAPATPGSYRLVATSTRNPTKQATITITVVAGPVINPAQVTLVPGQRRSFAISAPGGRLLPVTWSATAGTIGAYGDYQAPTSPGTGEIRARTRDGQTLTATVLVKSLDLDGSGRTAGSFGDLAAVADAFGTADPKADLDGNGTVDDDDVAEVMVAFERPAAISASRPGGSPAGS